MKIKSIKTWNTDLGTVRPYTIAFKTVDEVRNVFVEVILENGISGLGAGSPSEYVTGEYLESTIEVLSEENLARFTGRDILHINQLLAELTAVFPKNPAARAALDIALYDAFTKHLGIPLVDFLGRKMKSLPTSITIGIKNVEETLIEAREYADRGFSVLKIKLGIDPEEDIERIVKLREEFGSRFVIRIDANQGYNVAQTIDFFNRTKHLNIELIEQPLPAKAVAELKSLPDEIRKLVAADESLLTPSNALELVKPPVAAGIFNIKLMKCGGINQALKIADIAALENLDLFWGCNDESIVSITAALHAAFACPHTKYIDLDGSFDLARDEVRGGFILKDGIMSCVDAPGLGVERV